MSVLIKGMEMPKNCDQCIYAGWSNFFQTYVCEAIKKEEPVLFNGKQVKSTAIARSGRADNCPLVPVPPHGDLIDRDALFKEFERIGWFNNADRDIAEDALLNAPTIIEAGV